MVASSCRPSTGAKHAQSSESPSQFPARPFGVECGADVSLKSRMGDVDPEADLRGFGMECTALEMEMRDFSGKTAFVTGGASGIGFALAKAFLQAGMNVMLA